MTTASAGPSGFHTKHFVAAFAVAGFVAAILVIAQWLGSDSRPDLPPTAQVVTEGAETEPSVSANWEALAAGKLDDAPATRLPVTATVEAGTSGNWINYRDGKFDDAEAQPRTYEPVVAGGHQEF